MTSDHEKKERKKTDRRTLITCGMIRNALLELLKSTSYSKITVALLCRQAGITRAASNARYRTLFMDDDLSPLILKKLYEREHDSQTARIKELYHVNQKDADMILMKIGAVTAPIFIFRGKLRLLLNGSQTHMTIFENLVY